MTFNPVNDEAIEALILNNQYSQAVNAYRIKFGVSTEMAESIIKRARDLLLKDRSLTPETSDLLGQHVRILLDYMVTDLTDHLCVTRAHVLDHVVREAAKALKEIK